MTYNGSHLASGIHIYIDNVNEGLTIDIRKAFLVYLISNNRPIHELLNPGFVITKSIFEHIDERKEIQYTKKSYGKVIGIKHVSVDWNIDKY